MLCRVTRYVCYVGAVSFVLQLSKFFVLCDVGSSCVAVVVCCGRLPGFVRCMTVAVVLKIQSSGAISDVDW